MSCPSSVSKYSNPILDTGAVGEGRAPRPLLPEPSAARHPLATPKAAQNIPCARPAHSTQPPLPAAIRPYIAKALPPFLGHAEIEFLHVFVFHQLLAGVFEDDAPQLEYIAPVCDREGHERILFDDQDRCLLFLVDAADDLDGDGIPDTESAEEFTSAFSVSLSHPILRNFGITINMSSIKLAEYDLDILYLNLYQKDLPFVKKGQKVTIIIIIIIVCIPLSIGLAYKYRTRLKIDKSLTQIKYSIFSREEITAKIEEAARKGRKLDNINTMEQLRLYYDNIKNYRAGD